MRTAIVQDHTNVWKLVTILASLVALVALAVFAFQQREPIIEAVTGQKVFLKNAKGPVPTRETEDELKAFVNQHSLVMGVSVGRADFETNTRDITFNFSKVPEIDAAWKITEGTVTVLFGDDTQNNERLVQLINGQFVCAATAETSAAKMHPVIARHSRFTCTIAIPPGYGDFIGWVNIYLYEPPTFTQMEALQDITTKMTRIIYERDVLKRSNENQGSVPDAVIPIKN